ncbi:hypothetical protein MBLNU459_g2278t1 [Dothideomycetes sp. NU459]
MAPLASRNINAKGSLLTARHADPPRIGSTTPRVARVNNENKTPSSDSTKPRSAGRLHTDTQTKPASARSKISTSANTPSYSPLPVSRLPRRAETPTAHKDSVNICSRSQQQSAQGRSSLCDKPLPSRPMATHADELSPTKDSRLLIDASELPLRTSPGTPEEGEWPTLKPTLITSQTPSPTITEDWVRVSANYDLPTQNHNLNDLVQQQNSRLLVQNSLQEYSTPTPCRSSDSNGSTDYGQSSDRTHSPPPMSFSQPRVKQLGDPSTPVSPSSRRTSHHATASRIPIYEPRKTPHIVDIKARPIIETPKAGRTLGERLLGPQADLAAVDNTRKPRHLSSRMPRKGSSDSFSLAKRASLANMRQSIRRLPTSGQETESENLNPLSDTSSDHSSVRINQISGKLLSSSFPGSTLTIADEADYVIYGSPEKNGPIRHANVLSQKNADIDLDPALSLAAPDGSAPVKMTTPANVNELLSAHHGEEGFPGATIATQDEHTQEQITATLSLLEGTPPAETTPSREAFLSFASKYGKQQQQAPQDTHPAHNKELAPRSNGMLTAELRKTVATLPRYTATDSPRSRNVIDRVPSYMCPTPASEARRVSNAARLQVPSTKKRSIGHSSRVPSKASTLSCTDENSPSSFKPAVSRRTPSNNGKFKACSSGHTPLTESSDKLSTTRDGFTLAPKVSRVNNSTPDMIQAVARTRSRSKSRGMIDNIKGFFTGKQNVPPVPSLLNHANVDSLVSHTGSPARKRESMRPVVTPTPLSQSHDVASVPQSQATVTTNGQTLALTQMTLALMEEVNNEGDSPQKARMLSLAQVMLDAVSNAREAERSMLSAQQAAEAARMSYEMTQHSVVEMGRLISSSRHMPSLLKKLAAKTVVS